MSKVEITMSITSAFLGSADTMARAETRRPGLFARLIKALAAAREAQARRVVASHLATMSDDRLTDIGFTADEIKRVRAEGRIPASYWL